MPTEGLLSRYSTLALSAPVLPLEHLRLKRSDLKGVIESVTKLKPDLFD
jgi:hypothetical protein